MRIERRQRTESGHVGCGERVGAEKIVQLFFRETDVILFLAFKQISHEPGHAVVRDAHIGSPRVCLAERHIIGVGNGALFHGIQIFKEAVQVVACHVQKSPGRVGGKIMNGIGVHLSPAKSRIQKVFLMAFAGFVIPCVQRIKDGFVSGQIQIHCGEEAFVNCIAVRIFARGNVFGIFESCVFRVFNIGKCFLCRFVECVRKCRIIGLVNRRSFCRHCREIRRGCDGNGGKNQLIGLFFRRNLSGEGGAGHLVPDAAAFGILHFQHPFDFVAGFIQEVRDCISAFRNAEIIAALIEILKGHKQVQNGFRAGNHVSSVIARVVPSAAHIHGPVCSVDPGKTGMADFMGELGAGDLRICFRSASLPVEHQKYFFI